MWKNKNKNIFPTVSLAKRGSSFTTTELQRRRATTSYPTNNKTKSWNASHAAQTRNTFLSDHH